MLPGIFFLASLGAIVATFADPHTRQASVVAVAVLLSGAVVYTAFRRKRGPVQAPGGE